MATLTPLPLPQSFEDFCALFLLFIAYSTLGWCGEMIYCSVPKGRLCEKRGFLNGFLCPIYGHGALLVLYALRGGFRNPFLTFLFGALLTSALEYFTSWVMEKLFHMRWWDYSHYKFQINGRVCLLNSTCFGLACVLLCHVVHTWLWAPAFISPTPCFPSAAPFSSAPRWASCASFRARSGITSPKNARRVPSVEPSAARRRASVPVPCATAPTSSSAACSTRILSSRRRVRICSPASAPV